MNITRELDAYISETYGTDMCESRKALKEIADNIDTELAENYIELPKDKNGKTIHIWDTVRYTFADEMTGTIKVDAIVLRNDGISIEDSDRGFATSAFGRCEIVEPDTQENIDADAMSILDVNWTLDEREKMMRDILRRQRELDGAE